MDFEREGSIFCGFSGTQQKFGQVTLTSFVANCCSLKLTDQPYLSNARLEGADLRRFGDRNLIKLFKAS